VLTKSVKFTEPGGQVSVQCVTEPTQVAVRVTDTGCGIPAEQLEAVFEPFVQLDRSLTRPVEGTGLGLAISRHLARQMAGELIVTSTVGQGSTFTLLLHPAPAARGDRRASRRRAGRTDAADRSSPRARLELTAPAATPARRRVVPHPPSTTARATARPSTTGAG
jgi:hypothetical protein